LIRNPSNRFIDRFRRYWLRLSLQGKIVSLTSLLVMATVFALTFLYIQRERANFQRELLEQANLLLDATSLTMRDQLYRLQIDELNDVARVISRNPDVTVFIVYDQNGRVLVDSSQAGLIFSQSADPLGESLLRLGQGEAYTEWQDGQLLTGRAVILGNQPIGAVLTGLSTEPLDQKIRNITIQGILLGLVTLAVGAAMTVYLARQITNP
jgi:sensor histidine kinase regulating citrate/malate metabolism